LSAQSDGFYLTASRLVPYKKISLIAEAFQALPNSHLVIIGDGPEMTKERAAAGSNVKVLGYQPDSIFQDMMQRCKAFIYAAEEDFGIVPLEAQLCGKPVIAYGRGGALETIRGLDQSDPTGLFFWEQTAGAIKGAVTKFEELRTANPALFSPEDCRANALRFGTERFDNEFRAFVDEAIDRFEGWNGKAAEELHANFPASQYQQNPPIKTPSIEPILIAGPAATL
jgi:glycosyltransferase involved in cell wall biosynthesis